MTRAKLPESVALTLLVACGGRVEPARPVGSEFIEVDYPPPPAQIEEIDERLPGRPDCRWMDGHYAWRGRRWEWVPGRWVVPPAGCAWAPGTLTWSNTVPARLYYTPPYWYATNSNANQRTCPAPVPCQSPAPQEP